MSAQARFTDALLDPALPCPEGLMTWNGSDLALRFAVYRNNVVVSLVDALADTFPVTRELVGDEFFRAMAQVFVRTYPPRSRVLAGFGRDFPDFVETFPPAAPLPYLADVARLEMLRVQAYHAADVPPLVPAAIAGMLAEPRQLPALRIGCHPSAAILRSSHAVFSLWAAHQGRVCLSAVNPALPETVLVVRVGLDVQTIQLRPAVGLFIAHMMRGTNLATAVDAASADDSGFDLGEALAMLLRWQLITALHTGDHAHEHPY
ncbi:DNA-binding domain-containing protein [Aromatoleum diolicum]|uniref:DUF2063 domain-containing protein n=1 Tax=Aromatoleum diolicum TaxID=75796 RepID=A0ABX1Q4E7_9RHOO|nr:DNA-binding domain-containing protein [Aromatoleum diolicum]NMG73238.1 DUF2063 domain-containing protein [Aromatoleum diolicum]